MLTGTHDVLLSWAHFRSPRHCLLVAISCSLKPFDIVSDQGLRTQISKSVFIKSHYKSEDDMNS